MPVCSTICPAIDGRRSAGVAVDGVDRRQQDVDGLVETDGVVAFAVLVGGAGGGEGDGLAVDGDRVTRNRAGRRRARAAGQRADQVVPPMAAASAVPTCKRAAGNRGVVSRAETWTVLPRTRC